MILHQLWLMLCGNYSWLTLLSTEEQGTRLDAGYHYYACILDLERVSHENEELEGQDRLR
jgi:hypothetical protein